MKETRDEILADAIETSLELAEENTLLRFSVFAEFVFIIILICALILR